MQNLTGAITAGGQSRRFGSDKALAVWQGKTLLEHAAASLEGCAPKLLIAPPGKYELSGWTTIPDTRPGQGPLAGLEAALTHAPDGWVAFAGVDMPGLTPGYWGALAGARTDGAQAVLALDSDGRAQPLAALYHTDLLGHVTALLDSGERRLNLAAPEGQTVRVPGLAAGFFRNVNRVGDLNGSANG
ncbi:molybdenum cofactor guanylyltransferase [Deinococcus koreensis]|uniref:Probable molybdenum cofactor guanylyltransferase n=1 Tax=Deinococcus koreensis TaxID=2054903 RepID=A0A2K3UWM5_9DEIO|nr:molybdenum cofactor guanylyltransferase [Deinococcus koreensis]PNY80925.1 molybdenum cofactor guanylyltransferase [Deinococcus koreensis]